MPEITRTISVINVTLKLTIEEAILLTEAIATYVSGADQCRINTPANIVQFARGLLPALTEAIEDEAQSLE